MNGHSQPQHQRSFSSILTRDHDTNKNGVGASEGEGGDSGKPFVYSRQFLLSLYNDNKASRRPIDLVQHDLATTDDASKPWGLREWREGEKEVRDCFVATDPLNLGTLISLRSLPTFITAVRHFDPPSHYSHIASRSAIPSRRRTREGSVRTRRPARLAWHARPVQLGHAPSRARPRTQLARCQLAHRSRSSY